MLWRTARWRLGSVRQRFAAHPLSTAAQRYWVVLRRIGGLLIGGFVRGGRGGLLLEQAFHQGLVGQGRAQIRLAFEGLFISIHGRLQLAAFGQGVATIVVGVGVVALGEPLGGARVVAGFVESHALPLVIFEVPGRLGRAFLLEQVLALLVGAQPQVLEVEGIARLRQHEK